MYIRLSHILFTLEMFRRDVILDKFSTAGGNKLHFFTISNLNYTVFVSLAHGYVPIHLPTIDGLKFVSIEDTHT